MKKIAYVPFFTALLVLLSREPVAHAAEVGWMTKETFDLVLLSLLAAFFLNMLIIIVLMIRYSRQEENQD